MFGLGGNPRYLLVEFPYFGWPLSLETEIWTLRRRGITPVLAHPERNPEVQRSPARVAPLVAAGALVQLTAASVDGRLGTHEQAHRGDLDRLRARSHHRQRRTLAGLARPPALSSAAAAVGDPELAGWLTRGVPSAIVENEPIPPRPETASPLTRWLRT